MLRPRRTHGWQDVKEEKPKAKKNPALVFFIPVLIIVLLFGSCSLAKKYTLNRWSQNPSDYDNQTLKPKSGLFGTIKNWILSPDNVLEGQNSDRINILLLGIGGEGHDGGYLSDTNIILSVKPSTNEVAMISVPRDLSANIKGYGWMKINFAHAYGEMNNPGQGGEFALQTFQDTLGIKIPYYATVDFTAFQEIIDALGGVDIDVPRTFTDYSYPDNNYGYQTVTFTQGKETMNGARALIYARSRHGNNGEGSDFARARRQQIVIAAVKNKLMSAGTLLNPIVIKKIIDSVADNTSTNLDFGQIMFLASLAKKVDDNNIKTLVLDNANSGFLRTVIGYEGAYLLTPASGDFKEIQNAIGTIFSATTTPSLYSTVKNLASLPAAPNINIEIQNGTWESGLAAKYRRSMEDSGFIIYTIGNSNLRPIASSSIYIINKKVPAGFIDTVTRETNMAITNGLPYWMGFASSSLIQTDLTASTTLTTSTFNSTDTSTPASQALNYDPNTDILIILGEDQLTTNE